MTDPIAIEKVAVNADHDVPHAQLQQHGFQPYPLPADALVELSARAVWARAVRKKADQDTNKSDSILSNKALRALNSTESHLASVANARLGR